MGSQLDGFFFWGGGTQRGGTHVCSVWSEGPEGQINKSESLQYSTSGSLARRQLLSAILRASFGALTVNYLVTPIKHALNRPPSPFDGASSRSQTSIHDCILQADLCTPLMRHFNQNPRPALEWVKTCLDTLGLSALGRNVGFPEDTCFFGNNKSRF